MRLIWWRRKKGSSLRSITDNAEADAKLAQHERAQREAKAAAAKPAGIQPAKKPAGKMSTAKPVPAKLIGKLPPVKAGKEVARAGDAKKKVVKGSPLAEANLEKMVRTNAMAEQAAKWQPFADACKQQGYADPVKAFLEFYDSVKDKSLIWKREAKVEELMEDKGLRFSRAGFYAKLFIESMKAGKTKQ